MSPRREEGAGGVFIFALLLLTVVALLAVLTLSRTTTAVDEQAQTKANLAKAAAALEQFAGASGRLPCPADPTKDDGLASPNNASVNCDFPQGTLPWATIGMRRDDAFDAWGWKISYRVYSNIAGSMTQANGASMVNCDTSQALTTRQPVDATKLCPAAHDTIDSDFIAGKGLTVTDFGTLYDGTKASGGAAYVLVSHGMTGMGAYGAAGVRKDMPSSNDEKNNTKDTGPFVLEAASSPDVGSADINHYDDVLLYRTVTDLAKKANLAARDWPDDVLAGARFDSTTLGSVLGASVASGDLGVSTIDFGNFTVSAFDSGGTQNLAFTSGSTSGLGGVSGGGNNLTSTGGEGLQFDFDDNARQFSVVAVSLKKKFFGADRALVTFYSVANNVATKIGSDVLRSACGFSSTSSFTLDLASTGISDASATFNRVEIRPWTQTFFGGPSTFRVQEIRTCVAGVTCQTTIYGSGDQC